MTEVILAVLFSTFRVATPLVFASMGGLMSERSGVINIALEGIMLMGAWMAAALALESGSSGLGFIAGGIAGGAYAALYALMVITFRANQIVAGTAMNLLAFGFTPFLCKVFYQSTGGTPSLELSARLGYEPVFLSWVLVLALWGWSRSSRSGLWHQVAGEHPQALETAGVSVLRVRWAALLVSGVLAGWGGATLSIFLSSGFSREMTAGRGFIALAALIFGKWRPWSAAGACLLFGLVDALQIRLQGVVLWGSEPVPVQWIQILPYVLTMIVLAGFVGRSRAPGALGNS